jgi:hypothetical protein
MGKLSKQKGKRGERFVVNFLRSLGLTARRSQQYCGSEHSADVISVPGIHIESKFVERLNIGDAMNQAEADCGDNVPVIFHKRNRKPLMISFKAEDLITFVNSFSTSLAQNDIDHEEPDLKSRDQNPNRRPKLDQGQA